MKKIVFLSFLFAFTASMAIAQTNFPDGINLGKDKISIKNFKDEDDMSSNSATSVPSQQSTKAYTDNTTMHKVTGAKNKSFARFYGTSGQILQSALMYEADDGSVYLWNNGAFYQGRYSNGVIADLIGVASTNSIQIGDATNTAVNIVNTGNTTIYGTLRSNTIVERTDDLGVTIESVPVKDGLVDGVDVSAHTHSGAGQGGTVSHTSLSNIGTNTHVQIDSHIANVTTNPHNVDKGDVGLINVQNVDTTNAANISSGELPAARLPAPTTSARGGVQLGGGTTNFYRADGTWATPAGGGNVTVSGDTTSHFQEIPYWNATNKQLNAHGYGVDSYADDFTNDDAYLPSSKLVLNKVKKVISQDDENSIGTYGVIPYWTGNKRELFHGGYTVDYTEPITNNTSYIPSSKAVLQELNNVIDIIPKVSIYQFSLDYYHPSAYTDLHYQRDILFSSLITVIDRAGTVATLNNSGYTTISFPGSTSYRYVVTLSMSVIKTDAVVGYYPQDASIRFKKNYSYENIEHRSRAGNNFREITSDHTFDGLYASRTFTILDSTTETRRFIFSSLDKYYSTSNDRALILEVIITKIPNSN